MLLDPYYTKRALPKKIYLFNWLARDNKILTLEKFSIAEMQPLTLYHVCYVSCRRLVGRSSPHSMPCGILYLELFLLAPGDL